MYERTQWAHADWHAWLYKNQAKRRDFKAVLRTIRQSIINLTERSTFNHLFNSSASRATRHFSPPESPGLQFQRLLPELIQTANSLHPEYFSANNFNILARSSFPGGFLQQLLREFYYPYKLTESFRQTFPYQGMCIPSCAEMGSSWVSIIPNSICLLWVHSLDLKSLFFNTFFF